MPWHWANGASYTVVELPLGDYDYDLVSTQAGKALRDANNVTFVNDIARVTALVGTNEWTPDYVDVRVSKVWDDADDQDGLRPAEVTVHLLADGEQADTAVLSAENDWSATFAHLLARQETGEHIAYTIEEDAVDGYETAIAAAEDDEYTVTVVPQSPDEPVTDEPHAQPSQDRTIPRSPRVLTPQTGDRLPVAAASLMAGVSALAAAAAWLALRRRRDQQPAAMADTAEGPGPR